MQKKRDARAKLLFCLLNLLFFWRSCCRPRRWILKSLLNVFTYRRVRHSSHPLIFITLNEVGDCKSRLHNINIFLIQTYFPDWQDAAYHRVENCQLLLSKLMDLHRCHCVCCEIWHDFRIGLRSVQRFTGRQCSVCWPGLVLFAIEPNILQWESG